MNPVKILLLLVFYLGLVHADAQQCVEEGKYCLEGDGHVHACCRGLKCQRVKGNALRTCVIEECQALRRECGRSLPDCCVPFKCKPAGDNELFGFCVLVYWP